MLLLLLIALPFAVAQDPLQCVTNLFNGMFAANATLAGSCFDESLSIMYSVEQDGSLNNGTVAAFLAAVSKAVPGSFKEVIEKPSVLISQDGLAAVVWGEYQFTRDGKLDHCGVDSFQLYLRQKKDWKIIGLLDTRGPCART